MWVSLGLRQGERPEHRQPIVHGRQRYPMLNFSGLAEGWLAETVNADHSAIEVDRLGSLLQELPMTTAWT